MFEKTILFKAKFLRRLKKQELSMGQKAEEARTEHGTLVADTPKKLKILNYSDFCFTEQIA
jgi:hypothetical protein